MSKDFVKFSVSVLYRKPPVGCFRRMKIGTIIVSVTMKENRNQIKDSCVNPYKVVERVETIIKNDKKMLILLKQILR